MEAALAKRLETIEKKLDVLLKRTDPKAAEDVGKQVREALSKDEGPRPLYEGVGGFLDR